MTENQTCEPDVTSSFLVAFRSWARALALLVPILATGGSGWADQFVIVDAQGDKRELVGRLHGSGQGAYAILRPSGQLELVAQGAVVERDNTVEWKPLTPAEMSLALAEQFEAEKFRGYIENNFVIGMVLMDSLPRQSELRVTGFLKKAAKFMNNVQGVFERFARELRLEIRDPEVPLVLLIFESDEDFNTYTRSVTQGRGISAGNIAGFYNGLTNYLAIRMTECTTFEVPLHEAIHQQVYNRGVLQRLAPIPAWFNEGLAAGFEANEDRINAGPTKIHSRYAEQFPQAGQVTWQQLITDDLAFQGDVLAGDAYCHAWALHWLLATRHQQAYANYVHTLSAKQPLTKEDLAEREQDFHKNFGSNLEDLKSEFTLALQRGLKTQKLPPKKNSQPGYLRVQRGLAELELTAIHRGVAAGQLEVEGRMRNINPFRNLSYSVTVLTDGGTFAQWILPDVSPNRVVPLPRQYAERTVNGRSPQPSQTFRVQVRSILPDSDEARRWQGGNPPAPDL